jgi:hypothetical protein
MGGCLRIGLRAGNTSDSTETPRAIEACLALSREGRCGIVADSQACWQRPLGLCLDKQVGLITLGPRTCVVWQEWEAWGQQQGVVPLLRERQAGRARSRYVSGTGSVSFAAWPWHTLPGDRQRKHSASWGAISAS